MYAQVSLYYFYLNKQYIFLRVTFSLFNQETPMKSCWRSSAAIFLLSVSTLGMDVFCEFLEVTSTTSCATWTPYTSICPARMAESMLPLSVVISMTMDHTSCTTTATERTWNIW